MRLLDEQSETPYPNLTASLGALADPQRNYPHLLARFLAGTEPPTQELVELTRSLGYRAGPIINNGTSTVVLCSAPDGTAHALKLLGDRKQMREFFDKTQTHPLTENAAAVKADNTFFRHVREMNFLNDIARDNPYFVQVNRIVEWEHAPHEYPHRPQNDFIIDMELISPGFPVDAFAEDASQLYNWTDEERAVFAASVGRQVCDGLLGTLKKGQMYRPYGDLKANNLLMYPPSLKNPERFVKIIDANAVGRRKHDLQSPHEAISSTPTICAPEIIDAMAKGMVLLPPISMKSDVYALGCTLYKLVAGRMPFKARSVTELFEAHLVQTPDMSPVQKRASHTLAAIIEMCLSKHPGLRPNLNQLRDVLRFCEGGSGGLHFVGDIEEITERAHSASVNEAKDLAPPGLSRSELTNEQDDYLFDDDRDESLNIALISQPIDATSRAIDEVLSFTLPYGPESFKNTEANYS